MKADKYDILQALDEVKVLDPACGSGAFPMGMLHLLLQTYERIDSTFDSYKKKLNIIKNSLFGVDIEPMAVEISRLRAWLSIIVDEESDSKKIKPLPNLDFKFICANSLIPLEKNGQAAMGDDPNLENKITDIRDTYYNARKFSRKVKLKDDFNKLMAQKNQASLLGKSKKQEQLESFHPFDAENVANFFDPKFMYGESQFDVVIGNPPYVKEYTYKDAFSNLKLSPYYQGKMDLWYFFACYGLDILKTGGIQAFIAPNNWISNFGAKIMRKKILDEGKIYQFIDFGNYKVFDTAGIQTMVYLIKKDNNNKSYKLKYAKLKNDRSNGDILNNFLNSGPEIQNENFEKFIFEFRKSDFEDKTIQFLDSRINRIIGKIETGGNNFLNSKEVANGIHPHFDFVGKKQLVDLGPGYKIGDGIFALSNKEKEDLNIQENEKDLLKPYYLTSNFCKYNTNPKNSYWIIYTDSKFKNKDEIKKYPNIKKHLDKFTKVITSDNKPYGLHRARDERFFKGDKIVVARKCLTPEFSYNNFDCYVSATFYVIKTDRINIKYLLGLLNSKLIKFWLKHKRKMQGDNYQIDKEPLLQIPIKKSDKKNEALISNKINRILELTAKEGFESKNKSKEQLDIEKEIDNIVYKIYGLSDEEIKLIENN